MTPDEYIPSDESRHYEADTSHEPHYTDAHEGEEDRERGLIEWIENDLWGLPGLRKNIRFIAYCLFLVGVMIAWPYIYQGSLREITSLEKKLEDIRYKALFTSAALIEYERINTSRPRSTSTSSSSYPLPSPLISSSTRASILRPSLTNPHVYPPSYD